MNSKIRRENILTGIGILLISGLFFVYNFHQILVQRAIISSDSTTSATVIDLKVYGSPFVIYTYKDETGATYEGSQDVATTLFNTLSKGNNITVSYLKDNPSISGIPDMVFLQRDPMLYAAVWLAGIIWGTLMFLGAFSDEDTQIQQETPSVSV